MLFCSLKSTNIDYLEINCDQLGKFSGSICLDQTVAVWNCIVHYQTGITYSLVTIATWILPEELP